MLSIQNIWESVSEWFLSKDLVWNSTTFKTEGVIESCNSIKVKLTLEVINKCIWSVFLKHDLLPLFQNSIQYTDQYSVKSSFDTILSFIAKKTHRIRDRSLFQTLTVDLVFLQNSIYFHHKPLKILWDATRCLLKKWKIREWTRSLDISRGSILTRSQFCCSTPRMVVPHNELNLYDTPLTSDWYIFYVE